jgi:type IV pilus assembly protein PilW
MHKFKSYENNAGFSMLELMIALAIGLIVLAALGTVFVSQRKAYSVQEQVIEMTQTARAALDIMTRDVMMAGYDPQDALQKTDDTSLGDFAGIPYNSNDSVLNIYADLNNDGDNADANDHITYAWSSANKRITRDSHDGSNAQPFVENVLDFSVAYKNSSGNATTTTASIRQIQLSITVQTSGSDPDFSDNGGHRSVTLESHAYPRNLSAD